MKAPSWRAGSDTVAAPLLNVATIQVDAGTMSFASTVTNQGTMMVLAGAALVVSTACLGGTGSVCISAAGGTLELLQGAVASQSVGFLGAAGLLELGTPAAFQGVIAGFTNGDQVDLLKTPETGFSFAGGALTVQNGTTVVATLAFTGALTSASFNLAADGHGGTLITHV